MVSSSLWHPLTANHRTNHPIQITRAEGSLLFDSEDKPYFDAISSWYTAVFGHKHPTLIRAAHTAMDTMGHVVLSGATHPFAERAAQSLVHIAPKGLRRVFFSDNGSTAVEVGLKMGMQYWQNQGINSRKRILAFHSSFHGDTFGAMAVSDQSVYHGSEASNTLLVDHILVEKWDPEELNYDLEEYALCIYEPLVQGAAGMKMHTAERLHKILSTLRKSGVLLVADEVMTGMGKTGAIFASETVDISPDILCLSKAIGAGICPVGATLATSDVFDVFQKDSYKTALMHAHTYSGYPLGCAVVEAACALIQDPDILTQKEANALTMKMFTSKHKENTLMHNLRSQGNILAFELGGNIPRYGEARNALVDFFLRENILLRPLGNTLYIVPPYTTSTQELTRVLDALEDCSQWWSKTMC